MQRQRMIFMISQPLHQQLQVIPLLQMQKMDNKRLTRSAHHFILTVLTAYRQQVAGTKTTEYSEPELQKESFFLQVGD